MQSSQPSGGTVHVLIAAHAAFRSFTQEELRAEFPAKLARKLGRPDIAIDLTIDPVTGQRHDAAYSVEPQALDSELGDLCQDISALATQIAGSACRVKSVLHNGTICRL